MEKENMYQKEQYSPLQWNEIQKGLEQGLEVDIYANPEYTGRQMEQIRRGLEKDLDVSIYAKPEFNAGQMEEIRYGLFKGLDVSIYAKPEISWHRMDQMRQELEMEKESSICDRSFEENCKSATKAVEKNEISKESIESELEKPVENKDITAETSWNQVRGEFYIKKQPEEKSVCDVSFEKATTKATSTYEDYKHATAVPQKSVCQKEEHSMERVRE